MNAVAPVVLKDLKNQDFTEGDRVVYSASTGIRVGRVDWIREDTNYYNQTVHRVYIDLSEHTALDAKAPGKMFAKRQGYEYFADKFLKV